MASKNWTAAEKHFQELEMNVKRESRKIEAERNQLLTINKKLMEQVEMQRTEIDRLNEWVDRLLQYTELSREDINKACERDKSITSLVELLGLVRGIGEYRN